MTKNLERCMATVLALVVVASMGIATPKEVFADESGMSLVDIVSFGVVEAEMPSNKIEFSINLILENSNVKSIGMYLRHEYGSEVSHSHTFSPPIQTNTNYNFQWQGSVLKEGLWEVEVMSFMGDEYYNGEWHIDSWATVTSTGYDFNAVTFRVTNAEGGGGGGDTNPPKPPAQDPPKVTAPPPAAEKTCKTCTKKSFKTGDVYPVAGVLCLAFTGGAIVAKRKVKFN